MQKFRHWCNDSKGNHYIEMWQSTTPVVNQVVNSLRPQRITNVFKRISVSNDFLFTSNFIRKKDLQVFLYPKQFFMQ